MPNKLMTEKCFYLVNWCVLVDLIRDLELERLNFFELQMIVLLFQGH